ncbi:MAG: hypothetical protein HGGPFJEG_03031 [Ignavibacteria bacterium]|nr:hypothetical protein [Ignavibacteria bacterium]
MKKLITVVLLIFMFNSISAQQPPPPPLKPGEIYTNLYSVSYDYQTNGSVRYIVQDPTNASKYCAILMAQQDSNTAAGAERYIYYAYSEDNGNTWTTDVLNTTANWGFPDMSLRNGIPVIAMHRFNTGSSVYQDLFFGAFGFAEIAGLPTGSNWPKLTSSSNGNVTVIGSPNDNVFLGQYTTYNGSSWTPLATLPLIGGPSGNFSAASGANGLVSIFGTNYINDGYLYVYNSSDNGITFDNGSLVFDFSIAGSDTIFPSIVGGLQAVYVNTTPHLIFTAYNVSANVFPNANTIQYISPKLLHWAPGMGISEVAGKFNIPNLTDTITTALMAPVGQPSVGITASGKMICTFTAFLRGNTQTVDDGTVLNTGEIFYTISTNNGATWSSPVNITNTPGIEEKHSSIPEKSNSDSLKAYYLRDMKAGGWVNVATWGKAPVYGIFNKRNTIGINQISSEINSYELNQNYPNPFNPVTIIKFSISKSEHTSLIIYDNNGKEITKLISQKLNAGTYEYDFNAGKYGLSSGVYYYKLISGNFSETRKMILVK